MISVVITCFNEGDYIVDAVNSVINQTRFDLIGEILIVDDGSCNETISVLRSLEKINNKIIIYYRSPGNGLPAQRNFAIGKAKFSWIALLDGDDLWVKDKIEKQTLFLQKNNVGLVYSNFYNFKDGSIDSAKIGGSQKIKNGGSAVEYFKNDPVIMPSSIIFEKKYFFECGMFNEKIKVFEDSDFYLRIIKICDFGFVSDPLIYKRNRVGSITGGGGNLLAHHAFVALNAAHENSELWPYVARRISERARKFANQKILLNDKFTAKKVLLFALSIDFLNIKLYSALTLLVAVHVFGDGLVRKLNKLSRTAHE